MSSPPSPSSSNQLDRFTQPLVPSRPHTTGSRVISGRVRTPSSGRTNRKQVTQSSPLTQVPLGVLKTTGQYALNQTQSARPCVSSFNPKSDQPLETVSLLRLKVPESSDWMSEAKRSSSFTSPPQYDSTVLELAEEKQKNVQRAFDNYNTDKARRKLQRLINQKYAGSVDVLFQNADLDKNGVLDFSEFSAILKRNSLEQFFGRKDQRDIFKAIGKSGEEVYMDQFVDFLQQNPSNNANPRVEKQPLISPTDAMEEKVSPSTTEAMKQSGFVANMDMKRGPEMTFSTSPQQRTTEQELKKLAEESKLRIVEKLIRRRRLEKNVDNPEETQAFVAAVCKQRDEHLTGKLSREELEYALGPRWMNVGVEKQDIDQVIEISDALCDDGKIDYNKFIKELNIHELEVSYDPIMEARERGLKMMKDRAHKPFEFTKEFEEHKARADRVFEASAKLAEEQEEMERTMHLEQLESAKMRATVPSEYSVSTKPVPRLPGPGSVTLGSSKHRLGKVSSSQEMFGKMDCMNEEIMRSVGRRMTGQSEHHSMDNSRVGLGSGGVDPNSGLFADSDKRFVTTSLEYHAPLVYKPNIPVQRPQGRCDSVADAAARDQARRSRFSRTMKNLESTAEQAEKDSLFGRMNADQRERNCAQLTYGYLRKAYFKDLKLQSKQPLEVMSKKPNWDLFAKTYNTSKDTQLREMVRKPDSRDMATVHGRDMFKTRFEQTSFGLQGGVVPDLHRTSMSNRW